MSNSATLKAGGTRVAFGDVVQLARERTSAPEQDGFDRYVGLEHIEPGNPVIRRWGFVADGTTFTNVFRAGQVLFGKRRAYQRKVAVADFDGICSSDIYVLASSSDRLLPELLPFICQTDAFFEHAIGTSAGSLSPRTNWSSLAEYEFLLPSLDEQRRIADLLAATDAVCAAAQTLVDAADRQRKSYLLSVFRPERGTRDQYPSNWRVGTVDDAGEVQLGQKRDPSVHHGVNMRPYLRVANVFDDEIDLSDVLSMHFAERDLPKYLLRDGDILLNEGQSADLLGRSAIWRGQVENMCFQMTLLRFRARAGVLPEFAHAFFQHMLYTKQFAKDALQTTSIAHLSASKFGRMSFPVPPVNEQQEIVNQYGRFRSACRAARARAEVARSLRSKAIAEALTR
jgi:type I restriction enzyme S subunit